MERRQTALDCGARRVLSPHRVASSPWAGGTRYDESGFVGCDDGLGAVVQPEFVEDVADMRLDRLVSDHESAGDLGVR
jgi:hypothetical protein